MGGDDPVSKFVADGWSSDGSDTATTNTSYLSGNGTTGTSTGTVILDGKSPEQTQAILDGNFSDVLSADYAAAQIMYQNAQAAYNQSQNEIKSLDDLQKQLDELLAKQTDYVRLYTTIDNLKALVEAAKRNMDDKKALMDNAQNSIDRFYDLYGCDESKWSSAIKDQFSSLILDYNSKKADYESTKNYYDDLYSKQQDWLSILKEIDDLQKLLSDQSSRTNGSITDAYTEALAAYDKVADYYASAKGTIYEAEAKKLLEEVEKLLEKTRNAVANNMTQDELYALKYAEALKKLRAMGYKNTAPWKAQKGEYVGTSYTELVDRFYVLENTNTKMYVIGEYQGSCHTDLHEISLKRGIEHGYREHMKLYTSYSCNYVNIDDIRGYWNDSPYSKVYGYFVESSMYGRDEYSGTATCTATLDADVESDIEYCCIYIDGIPAYESRKRINSKVLNTSNIKYSGTTSVRNISVKTTYGALMGNGSDNNTYCVKFETIDLTQRVLQNLDSSIPLGYFDGSVFEMDIDAEIYSDKEFDSHR